MGGAMGANDDEVLDWIGPVKELIRDAVAEGVPTLGICLGHQLMGAALGGRVTPNPRGQQVGLLEVGWTDEAHDDRLFAGLATPRRGVQWNYDLVVEPPAGRRGPGPDRRRRDPGRPLRPPTRGASSCTPRSTRRSSPPGSPTPSAPSWPTAASTPTSCVERDPARPAPSSTTPGRRWRPGSRTSRWARRREPAEQPPEHHQGQPDPARLPGPRAVAWTQLGRLGRRRRAAGRACSPAPPTPTWRSPRWSGWSRRPVRGGRGAAPGAGRRRGHRDAAALGARRQRGAGRPPVPPPRALARAHRPDAWARPGRRRTPSARTCSGPSAPTRTPGADGDPARRRGGGRAARRVPPGPAPPGLPRPHPPPRPRRRGRRALRPGRRHPRRRPGRRPAAGRRDGAPRRGWPWSRWASAAATSSTTSPTST